MNRLFDSKIEANKMLVFSGDLLPKIAWGFSVCWPNSFELNLVQPVRFGGFQNLVAKPFSLSINASEIRSHCSSSASNSVTPRFLRFKAIFWLTIALHWTVASRRTANQRFVTVSCTQLQATWASDTAPTLHPKRSTETFVGEPQECFTCNPGPASSNAL